jgi:hypothetical protein
MESRSGRWKSNIPTGRGWSYQSVKTKTQVAGMDTRIVRDDVYEILVVHKLDSTAD